MIERNETISLNAARATGMETQFVMDLVINKAEDLAMLSLQQLAIHSNNNPLIENGLIMAATSLHRIRRVSRMVPLLSGRVVAATTYIGLHTGLELLRGFSIAKRIIMGQSIP